MQVSSSSSAQALEQMKQMREKMFSRADQDSSGDLSLDEFESMAPGTSDTSPASSAGSTTATNRAAEVFASLDTDDDGSVTSAELEAGRSGGRPPGPPPQGGFSSDSMSALLSGQEASTTSGSSSASDDLFASLDTDGDGSLSASEFQAAGGTQGAGGPRGAGGPPPGGPPPGGPPPGGAPDGTAASEDDDTSASSLLSSSTDGGSMSDALAALVQKALQNYMSASTTQSASSTLLSA
ncbi:EF-hand domain-containing protein [Roseomonas elaeocarpi]|uniref:EF-hand domain-containing protein n=1 Tax=Roseomonas elaeocarpi TaxID=907779 RepID=A0ABV6JRT2_9PROT